MNIFRAWVLIWRQNQKCLTEYIPEQKPATLTEPDNIFSNTLATRFSATSKTLNPTVMAEDGSILVVCRIWTVMLSSFGLHSLPKRRRLPFSIFVNCNELSEKQIVLNGREHRQASISTK